MTEEELREKYKRFSVPNRTKERCVKCGKVKDEIIGTVYGPLCLECNDEEEKEAAKEIHEAANELMGFICEKGI